MRKTIRPKFRQTILHKHITLEILQEEGKVFYELTLNFESYNFHSSAEIWIEVRASNSNFYRGTFYRENLCNVNNLQPDMVFKKELAGFYSSKNLKFAVKVVDYEDSRLLGLAENLKGQRDEGHDLVYLRSDNIYNIYEIKDYDYHTGETTVHFNLKLKEYIANPAPLILESIFRDILLRMLLNKDNEHDATENPWMAIAMQYMSPDSLEQLQQSDDPYLIISNDLEKIVEKFSVDNKLLTGVTHILQPLKEGKSDD